MGNLRQNLSERLAALRAAKAWTQHDLAAECGKSASWVRGYEQMTRWPDPEDLDALGNALGVSAADLVSGNEGKPKKLRLFELIPALDDSETEEVLAFAEALKTASTGRSASKPEQPEFSRIDKKSSNT